MKTRKQKEREKKHNRVIKLFQELNAKGGSRMAIWETLEKKTGYSREYITLVLRRNGIDYSKQNENGD